jgi:DMSO/TMAO reductase YedYZ molybdopterin-dependent catalytic subunit
MPAGDGSFDVFTPTGGRHNFSPADLAALPYTIVPECLIVSTGHGVSGPFTFGGVRLADLLAHVLVEEHAAQGTTRQVAGWAKDPGVDPGEERGEDRSGDWSEGRQAARSAGSDAEQAGGVPAAARDQWLSAWSYIDLVSADGFGTRVTPADLAGTPTEIATRATAGRNLDDPARAGDRPILLAYMLDGAPLTREQGLVRLVVPSETDDALRQVKWLATITIV